MWPAALRRSLTPPLLQLGRIEADLREAAREDAERRGEAELLRRQENRGLRTSLCHLSLSQRLAR